MRGIFTSCLAITVLMLQSCGNGGTSTANGNSREAYPLTILPQGGEGQVNANNQAQNGIIPFQLIAEGGAPQHGYTWSMTPGTSTQIPDLAIDTRSGLVSGGAPAPGTPGGIPGTCRTPEVCSETYSFEVTVSDGSNSVIGLINVHYNLCGSSPIPCNDIYTQDLIVDYQYPYSVNGGDSVTSTNINATFTADPSAPGLPPGSIPAGVPFGLSLSATGGVPPYINWYVSSGSLPPGLMLDPDTGVIYGIPMSSAAGNSYVFYITASDSGGHISPDPTLNDIVMMNTITISNTPYQ